MTLTDRLLSLTLTLDECRFEALSTTVPSGWTRHSTIVKLHGAGVVGSGEDVTYGAEEQLALQTAGPPEVPTGRMSLGDFCAWASDRDLFTAPPAQAAYRDYRLWAFQSAALDLALRQAEQSVATVVERTPRPLRFCASMGLGNPPSLARPHELRALHPALEFKLDAEPEWDLAFVGELAAFGGIGVVDLKGAYEGTTVDTPPDAALATRIAEGLPDAYIEDPHRTPEVLAALEPHRERISWDAPIHSLADVARMPLEPRVLNIKPSRLGSIERLFELYTHCEAEGITAYGGGQFELGVGRLQIQRLAALFHPDGPNDTAPAVYNAPAITPALPPSPLQVKEAAPGL